MKSELYRKQIRGMASKLIKRRFPGLDIKKINEVAKELAINLHARFYGANVDGVESPIWRDDFDFGQSNVEASKILED
jgi:hypothetical protein